MTVNSDRIERKPQRPALRYHGGKWTLAPWIISHFPPHKTYVEPFGGAASVLLQKSRSRSEIYNDLNDEVVNLFRVLRDNHLSHDLKNKIENTPFSRTEYYESYESDNDPVEKARRLLIRSFMGFGAEGVLRRSRPGFRANTRVSGTPAEKTWSGYKHRIDAITARLQGVVIENKSALDVISEHDSVETLIYCDPPYVFQSRSECSAGKMYSHEMEDDEHRDLADKLKSVSGMVVVSGYKSRLYDSLYSDWRCVTAVSYADRGKTGRVSTEECLWLNPACQDALGSDLFAGAIQ